MSKIRKPWKIVAIDPGTVNCGLAVIEWLSPSAWHVVHCSMVKNTVKDLKSATDVRGALIAWSREIGVHVKDADFVVVERFEARGTTRMTTGEAVSMMIGLLYPLNKRIRLTKAMIWKPAVKRRFDLKLAYRTCSLPPHVLDSAMIGLWAAYLEDGAKPFADWTVRDVGRLVGQLKACYTPGLKAGHRPRKIKRLREFVADLKRSFKDSGKGK